MASPIAEELPVPLSESALWQLQRRFYEEQGVDAWRSGDVPWYITSNAFLARAYAWVVLGYVQDLLARDALDASEPLHVVELGAGHGRFGHLLRRRICGLLERAPIPALDVRYVSTDVAESNLEFQSAHPLLAPHIASGAFDVARFDCENDTELELRHSGLRLGPGSTANPIVVVANYIFDTLRQDAFQVRDGRVEEGLVRLMVDGEPAGIDDPGLIERVSLEYTHLPVPEDRYEDPALNAILLSYARELSNTSFPFPTAAFGCLARLRAISGDRLLLLSADKGYNHPSELLAHTDPQPVAHGSFSLSVNYHAIGEWFRAHGGVAMHTSPREASLGVSAFALGKGPFAGAQLAFAEHVEEFGPIDVYTVQDAALPTLRDLSLEGLLAMIRMSGFDPRLFYQCADALLDVMDDASEFQRRHLRRAMDLTWDNYFPLGETQDLPFELGRLQGRMEYYRDALRFYRLSVELFGDDRATFHNMGMAHYGLRELDEALACFDRALELDENYSSARSWRLRIRTELDATGG